jgi:hypothetical protein
MAALAAETLECVALLERDRNEDLLTTWFLNPPPLISSISFFKKY